MSLKLYSKKKKKKFRQIAVLSWLENKICKVSKYLIKKNKKKNQKCIWIISYQIITIKLQIIILIYLFINNEIIIKIDLSHNFFIRHENIFITSNAKATRLRKQKRCDTTEMHSRLQIWYLNQGDRPLIDRAMSQC